MSGRVVGGRKEIEEAARLTVQSCLLTHSFRLLLTLLKLR